LTNLDFTIVHYHDLSDDFELSEPMHDITYHSFWGAVPLTVITTRDIDQTLPAIDPARFRWAVVISSGSYLYSLDPVVDAVDYARKSQTPLVAHLLHRDAGYSIHNQFFVIDLRAYQAARHPRLTPQSKQRTIRSRRIVRSDENIHHDYTPLWVKSAAGFETYDLDENCFGSRLINAFVNIGYEIKNVPQSVRQRKLFLYPQFNTKALKNLRNKNFDIVADNNSDLGRFRSLLWDFEQSTVKSFYATNTEPMALPVAGKKFDFLAAVCGGIKPVCILGINDFVPDTKVLLFDFSPAAIQYQKYLRSTWDGDLNTFHATTMEFARQNPELQIHGYTANNLLNNVDWFLKYTCIPYAVFKRYWKFYLTLDVEFARLDLFDDSSVATIKRHIPQSDLNKYIWISNSFTMTAGVFYHTRRVCNHRKQEFCNNFDSSNTVIEESGGMVNIDMRADEFVTESTVAGGIATVSMPLGTPIQREVDEDLKKWFREKWVRFGPDGKIRGNCARGSESEGKPKCLPQSKAHALGKKGRASAAARKRREDPNPERRGSARNVATKKS
jgi:hypothetical protein